jgi:hypothetical protein
VSLRNKPIEANSVVIDKQSVENMIVHSSEGNSLDVSNSVDYVSASVVIGCARDLDSRFSTLDSHSAKSFNPAPEHPPISMAARLLEIEQRNADALRSDFRSTIKSVDQILALWSRNRREFRS